MRFSRKLSVAAALMASAGTLAFAGSASAAFPNFSDCPRTAPGFATCIDIQARSGTLDIKGFVTPLGESLEIRGGIKQPEDNFEFIPPAGTSGFFARPVQVPGGLLGIDFPLPGNAVTATAKLAGSPQDIRINIGDLSVKVPVKLELSNPLIGPGCQIGSNRNPVNLNLIVGTTNPPPPNTPISGQPGTIEIGQGYLAFRNTRNVDNSFSVPGATGCGINLGLINALVNTKLRLPSASGNNAMIVVNDVALGQG